MVPYFARTKLPRAGHGSEENARLCNVFWRPWTLCHHFTRPPHVPHITQLALPMSSWSGDSLSPSHVDRQSRLDAGVEGSQQTAVIAQAASDLSRSGDSLSMSHADRQSRLHADVGGSQQTAANAPAESDVSMPSVKRRRLQGKQDPEERQGSHAKSWAEYIRGNVLSNHAARLITNFLTATMARSAVEARHDESESEEDIDYDDDEHQYQPALDTVHAIINSNLEVSAKATERTAAFAQQQQRSIDIGRAIWSTERTTTSRSSFETGGNIRTDKVAEYTKAARKAGQAEE